MNVLLIRQSRTGDTRQAAESVRGAVEAAGNLAVA